MPHRELLESFIEEGAEVLSGLEHGVAGLWQRGGPSAQTHAPERAGHLNDLSFLALQEWAPLQGRLDTCPQLSGEQHQEVLHLPEPVNVTLLRRLSTRRPAQADVSA